MEVLKKMTVESARKQDLSNYSKNPYFFSATIDGLLVGGLSILCFVFFYLFVDKKAAISRYRGQHFILLIW